MKKHIYRLAALLLLQLQVGAASSISTQEAARGVPNVASQTSGNWDLSADALVWYASEQSSAIWVDIVELGTNSSSFTPQDIGFEWAGGFRVGAGHRFQYDQWDTQLYWTWFRTKAHQTKRVNSQLSALPPEFGEIHPEFFAADLSNSLWEGAKIRWALLFNMCDWELGRCYWVSKGLSLRPFIGLKGGWIDQAIDVKYEHLIVGGDPSAISGKERVKNNFWGIGPVGGVNTKWRLRNFGMHFPSFFGDFSVATLWGTWICSDVYNDEAGEKVTVKTRNSTLGALMLRGFMGLGWDVDFNQGGSHFSTQLGYETQLWVNQLRVATSQLVRLHGDLTLQGVTFNCRFDF